MTKLDLPRRVSVVGATEYYVDAVAGSDSNPGTMQSPVQTIAKVMRVSECAARPRKGVIQAVG